MASSAGKRKCDGRIDMINMWGVRSLRNDPADPMGERIPISIKHMLGLDVTTVFIGSSGSDAISHLCTLADFHVARARSKTKGTTVLTFSDSYGAARGPLLRRARPFLKESVALQRACARDDDTITAPWNTSYDDLWLRCVAEMDRGGGDAYFAAHPLSSAEGAALAEIEARVNQLRETPYPVGGIVYEIVQHSAEFGLSPTFVRELRRCCVRCGIASLEDACMTSVRCGWRLLSDVSPSSFRPDAVAVSKAWGAGVVGVSKNGLFRSTKIDRLGGMVTSVCDRSICNMLEKKLEHFGAEDFYDHILRCNQHFRKCLHLCRGLGLLIHTTDPLPNAKFAYERLLPFLDITIEEIELCCAGTKRPRKLTSGTGC